MGDKQYKLIKENWDNYIKEDQENLEEVQIPGMGLVITNLGYLATFFDFLAKVLKNKDLKQLADVCRSADTAMKKIKKDHPLIYNAILSGDFVGSLGGKGINKALTVIRAAFGVATALSSALNKPAPELATQDDDISPEDMEPIEP